MLSVSAPAPCDVSCHLHQACGFDFSALGGDLDGARTAAEGALRDADASPAAIASVASECQSSDIPVSWRRAGFVASQTWHDRNLDAQSVRQRLRPPCRQSYGRRIRMPRCNGAMRFLRWVGCRHHCAAVRGQLVK